MTDKALQGVIEEILWDEFGPWRMDDGGPTIASVAEKIMEAVRVARSEGSESGAMPEAGNAS